MAVAQTALAAVHAAHAGAASAAANASEAGAAAAAVAEGVDDGAADGLKSDKPELLAALVEKLHELVPDVQLLVLPVLLPGGR
jgi:hypothetical protein